MAWPHSRAAVNPNAPTAWGTCDRCQQIWNLSKLNYQYQWFGDQLSNTRFRVCPPCMDVPQDQLRPLHLPPDPEPVIDPRPYNYYAAENGTNASTWDESLQLWDNQNGTWDS